MKTGKPKPAEDKHLDTVENLKKRIQWFKLPMPGGEKFLTIKKVENEPTPSVPPESLPDSDVKPERPSRNGGGPVAIHVRRSLCTSDYASKRTKGVVNQLPNKEVVVLEKDGVNDYGEKTEEDDKKQVIMQEVFKECHTPDVSGDSYELSLIGSKCIGAYVRSNKKQIVNANGDRDFQHYVQYKTTRKNRSRNATANTQIYIGCSRNASCNCVLCVKNKNKGFMLSKTST